jgi:glutamate-1-semialdehyde aminotransferase
MAKYAVIEIATGKFHEPFMYDDTSMPINTEELKWAELTDTLIDSLTNHHVVIDYNNTTYINGRWTEVFITPEKVTNYQQSRESDRQKFLKEANRKLLISDSSASFTTAVNNYITLLNALVFTNNEIQQINWPQKPW